MRLLLYIMVVYSIAAPAFGGEGCVGFYDRLGSAVNFRNSGLREWELSPAVEAELARVAGDASLAPAEKVGALYELLLAGRLETLGPMARRFAARAARTALDDRALYSRLARRAPPHYNAFLNRISLGREAPADFRRFLMSIHEQEHAVHRNSAPGLWIGMFADLLAEGSMVLRTPIQPLLLHRAETRAIGAQWELAHRLTTEDRRELMALIPAGDDASFFDRVLRATLEHADLGKEDFVRRLADLQGYRPEEMVKRHVLYSFRWARAALAANAGIGLVLAYWEGRDPSAKDVNATDLRFLLRMTGVLTDPGAGAAPLPESRSDGRLGG